jgi:hypothetical protein
VSAWRFTGASAVGTSHTGKAVPCQDAHAVEVVPGSDERTLVVCVADGAGSASHSQVGAALACEVLLAEARTALAAGTEVTDLSRDVLLSWMQRAKGAVERRAAELQAAPRELACTAVLAVVGESAAAFAQVGDGASVVARNGGFAVVFWPAPGEYANMTDFLTDANMADQLVTEVFPERIDELAVMSDGLQRLALDFANRRGHAGFFAPLFATLREHPDPAALAAGLRAFLDSAPVNARTDDDKTLVLATRLNP